MSRLNIVTLKAKVWELELRIYYKPKFEKSKKNSARGLPASQKKTPNPPPYAANATSGGPHSQGRGRFEFE
ncbi:hypothetical protein AYI69_g5396 [Smittium culicis]|uniref:Uncharacterized protein n=1 Tax=Smittium culicis TaxID=133412 RepID=A0A1R1Y6K8_9FUNG|nr:hypothetical protein AYI69_g5396 [Smittium culicis]